MEQQDRTKQGIFLALGAYTMWGIAPLYFKAISSVPALEILSHRVIWSFFFLILIISVGKNWHHVATIFKQPKKLALLFCSSILIAINWLVFIWAVNNNHMIDASLGYFINPLINVLLGMIFLGERLRKLQWFAVLLATIAVIIELINFGSLPWVALTLACSFAFYGLLRKKINIDAKSGLLLETMILWPIASVYLFFFAQSSTSEFSANPLMLNILLISAGVVTTLPLLCFTAAATRLKLSTLGFFQYIGPSLMFLFATLLYHEPFTAEKGITFIFIIAALTVFTGDSIHGHRGHKTAIAKQ